MECSSNPHLTKYLVPLPHRKGATMTFASSYRAFLPASFLAGFSHCFPLEFILPLDYYHTSILSHRCNYHLYLNYSQLSLVLTFLRTSNTIYIMNANGFLPLTLLKLNTSTILVVTKVRSLSISLRNAVIPFEPEF